MLDYFKLGQGIINNFPTTEGSISLGEKGIQAFQKKNPELKESLDELTKDVTNPSIEIAQKAQGNYSIAYFKLKSGNKLLKQGAYSTTKSPDGVVEKVHVEADGLVTTMSKENGKTKMRVIEKPETSSTPQKPSSTELTHEEIVDSFFKRQSDVIKGLDKKNHWVHQAISNMSPKELEELENLANDAAKKGMKIPFDKEYEYIEMLLPMTDGRKHAVKIFPGFYRDKLNMRIYLDKDIPDDKYKTYRDVDPKHHPGALHSFEIICPEELKKDLQSDNALERLKARKKLADKINYMWDESEAKYFVDTYEKETHYYLWQKGIHQSPLKPSY